MWLRTKVKTLQLHKRTHIMGILNITPDSFSDGGKYTTIDKAVKRAIEMEDLGADIIDIGGESTRPDHKPISSKEEQARVIPIIEAIKGKINIPISIDTYKSETAKHAINAGASIINDIWGAKRDEKITRVAAEFDVPIILMHNRKNKIYQSLIKEMIIDLQESISIAKRNGVSKDNIIIDPGIGFAKKQTDNYKVMNQLECFAKLGYPLLLATSRKSFIQEVLDLPANERDNATGATTCLGIVKGAHIIRVHDVKRTAELATMMDAMLKGEIKNG